MFIRDEVGMSSKYHTDLYNRENQIRLDEDTKGTVLAPLLTWFSSSWYTPKAFNLLTTCLISIPTEIQSV